MPGEALGHLVERRTRAENIHVEDDAGLGWSRRTKQPRSGRAVLRLDLNILLRHHALRCLCCAIDIRAGLHGKS